MTTNLVQFIGAVSHDVSETSTVLTVSKTITAGNTLVILASYYAAAGTPTCADNLGNSYAKVEADNGNSNTVAIFAGTIVTGGSLTTITVAHSSSAYNSIIAGEYPASSSPAAGGGTSGASVTSCTGIANKTIPANGFVVFGGATAAFKAGVTVGTSGTPSTSGYRDGDLEGGSSMYLCSANTVSQVTGYTGAFSWTGATNTNGAGVILSPAAAPGYTPVDPLGASGFFGA